MNEYIKFEIIGIDAFNDEGWGWEWNNMWKLGTYHICESELTPRRILKFLRDNDYLTRDSIGKLTVDLSCDDCIEIQLRNGMPLFALSTVHGFSEL